MGTIRALALGAACTAGLLVAVETKTWTHSEASEFEKGTLKNLSLASDGRVTLAPVMRELHDPAAAYLWAVAVDAKGTAYYGGAGGKLFSTTAAGKSETVAEIGGGDIYAIAVNAAGEVFVAVSPDAKVYRVNAGKPLLFCDTKEKYVWAMAFHPSGDLYLATGDQGRVLRVDSAGKSSVFFESEETHVRSLAIDKAGNLILGTEPGGLVLRVSSSGEGFVLYQTPRREVTALAVSADGSIYAAAVGAKPSAPVTPSTPAATPAVQPITVNVSASGTSGQTGRTAAAAAAPPPSLTPSGPSVAGSDVFKIEADGAPRRVWTHAQHVIYALALDSQQGLMAASGNQGVLYRIESERVSTRVRDTEPSQITALAAAKDGRLLLVTANAGKLYQVGPGLEKNGTLESESFDANHFTYWGRLRHEGQANGGSITLEARSGNLERAQKFWSPWKKVTERIDAPAARFLGWRATLTASPDGKSPVLSLVEAAYLAKNVAPVIEHLEATPANYKFSSSSLTLSSSNTLNLPAMGQPRRSSPSTASGDAGGAQSMTYEKGSAGARWKTSDANGDSLRYKLEIRGVAEKEWKLLKDDLKEARHSWDSTAFADGRYVLRVTATDAYDNYPGQALTAELAGEPFTVDNSVPEISGLAARLEGGSIVLRFKAADAWTPLMLAEYSVNGADWVAAEPATKLTDSLVHDYQVTFPKPAAGTEFTIAVRVTDENDNVAIQKVVLR